jgi:hypothetical protein
MRICVTNNVISGSVSGMVLFTRCWADSATCTERERDKGHFRAPLINPRDPANEIGASHCAHLPSLWLRPARPEARRNKSRGPRSGDFLCREPGLQRGGGKPLCTFTVIGVTEKQRNGSERNNSTVDYILVIQFQNCPGGGNLSEPLLEKAFQNHHRRGGIHFSFVQSPIATMLKQACAGFDGA